MTLFIQNLFDLDRDRAFALQKDLLNRFGTTASGLMQEHNIDPSDFMAFVHDINLDDIDHDPELDQLLAGLPGTKVIFTNGTERHAEQILNAFGISHHFSGCYDIIRGQFRPKPDPVVYQELLRHHGITPGRAVMVEDMAVNLKPAYDLASQRSGCSKNWICPVQGWITGILILLITTLKLFCARSRRTRIATNTHRN